MVELPNRQLAELLQSYEFDKRKYNELSRRPWEVSFCSVAAITSMLVMWDSISEIPTLQFVYLGVVTNLLIGFFSYGISSWDNLSELDKTQHGIDTTPSKIAQIENWAILSDEARIEHINHLERSVDLARGIGPGNQTLNADPSSLLNRYRIWNESVKPIELRQMVDRNQDELLLNFDEVSAKGPISDMALGLDYAWFLWQQTLNSSEVESYESAYAQGMVRKLKTKMQTLVG